ncbi:GNAT family N-acetyltransferase [Clostridium sp. CS001]|uniref:GNAT family N-acetyltransferase n=1 Tax=Clostridium sp. CS001 TaxID=2880648 RepID=UPI001CF428E1|nr:GNAT family N-acetyltransferase [Clostridium sp. CS001]MCB2291369.1 GNAT family N-acetyltransferase [Clostridium sp. CS001]
MEISCRKFQGKEDYFKLKEFLEDSISVSGPKFYFNVNSLEFGIDFYEDESYAKAMTNGLSNSFLWFEGDRLIGGIWANRRAQLFINPRDKHRFREMFIAAEEVVNRYIKENKETLGINDFSECSWRAFDGDMEIEKVLIDNKYQKTDEYWVLRSFDHKEAIKKHELPEGYYIKTLSELPDISQVIEIYNQCLGMEFNELSLRRAKESPNYKNELDVIVMTTEHMPVALCSGRYDKKNKMASFEAVACLREHRKKGISKALMFHALTVAKDLGAEISTVFTLTPDQFPAPNRLYESVGFELVGNRYTWKSNMLNS